MATAPTNTLTGVNNIGQREDLEDDIYRIAPEKTPFTGNIGRTKATALLHEWQTEDLRTPDPNNANLGGFNVNQHTPPNISRRVSNYVQLLSEDVVVAKTQDAVKKAGRSSETDRQKMLKGIEMKRDFEIRAAGNYPSQNEGGAITVTRQGQNVAPRLMAGVIAWSESVNSRGVGGVDGGFQSGGSTVNASTPGTARTFTEDLVRDVLASGFSQGAQYSQCYLGPTLKQTFSTFNGIAETRHNQNGAKMASIIGAADIYVSDFGNITLVPHQYAFTTEALLVDPSYLSVATLRGMQSEELGPTGDNERYLMTCEKTLVVRNERAIAPIQALA